MAIARSNYERREMVRNLEAGDLIVSASPSGGKTYLAVLERDGVKVILSSASANLDNLKNLFPRKNISGPMEITEDGTLALGDGSSCSLWSWIIEVRPQAVCNLAESFARRPHPRQVIMKKGLRIEAGEQFLITKDRVYALVFNQDYEDNFNALLEMFFRIIGKNTSTEETTFYFLFLCRALDELRAMKMEVSYRRQFADSLDEIKATADDEYFPVAEDALKGIWKKK